MHDSACNSLNMVFYITASRLKIISYFSTKTFVVGTQKNRLIETILLGTQTKC